VRGSKKQELLLRNARSQRIAIHKIEDRILLKNMPALQAIRARTRGRRRT
jgi:hypothetical protein